MDFYKKYFMQYLEADTETRKKAFEHWTKVHTENLLTERKDLIIFTAQILASITLAEKTIRKETAIA